MRGCSTMLLVLLFALWTLPAAGVILWSDLDRTLANENGIGRDILDGAVKRDDSSNDTLYFRFRIDPLSDENTEPYFAALELFEGDVERLGIGNAMEAWAYSAFFSADEAGESNRIAGYVDLRSSRPSRSSGASPVTYQLPQRGDEVIVVFKVQYVPGADDLVTVWLNPDLGPGATEAYQPETLITKFNANASFDEIRLRHSGLGGGWNFSDMAVATAFNDFVDPSSAKPGRAVLTAARLTQSLTFRLFQREQGLPDNNVRALAQTREGYLWVATEEGLTRFDGVRFVAFGARQGLNTGTITTMYGDSSGALWIGTATNGLIRWQRHQATTFRVEDGLPSASITALAEDELGRLWVGTEGGLAVWQHGRKVDFNHAHAFKGRTITSLFNDGRGNLWISARGDGVFKHDGQSLTPITEPSMEDLLQESLCHLVDRAGRVWIGTGEGIVICREGDTWRRYKIPRHLGRAKVCALTEEIDGTVWAALAGGALVGFKDGELAVITASSGLTGNLTGALLLDQNGRLWVGTDAGLNQVKHKKLIALGQGEGLGIGAVQGMAEVGTGVIWAAKPKDGLYRWDGREFVRLTPSGLSSHNSQVNSLLAGRDGGCWVATTRGLLYYKDPRAAADEVMVFTPPGLNIVALAEGQESELWVGTKEGELWQLHEGKWIEHGGLAQSNAITAIVPEKDGSLWIGTDGSGLLRYRNGVVDTVNKSGGLLSDHVRTLHLDAEETLWIGTSGGGLSRWRAGKVATFSAAQGLPDNTISQILEDDAGRLWLGNNRGIACVTRGEIEALASGEIAGLHPQTYGREEGMLSEECTGGFFPSALKTSSGMLWFSTTKGIVVVDPRMLATNTPATSVLLEEVLVDDVPDLNFQATSAAIVDVEGRRSDTSPPTLHIPPGRHRIDLRFTALGFDVPERVNFRYQLEGMDLDWVSAGTHRTASYNYVPPGNYRLRIAAGDDNGTWIENERGINVVVSRYLWQTWWFISLVGIGILFVVVATARLVEKRKLGVRLKRLEQERALERERTRIAQDLHDEMGSKLCRISFLSEHARRGSSSPSELQEQIGSISDASREVLHSLDEIVWAVNPHNDTLEHLASYIGQHASEYFQMTGIECELDIPSQLPAHPVSSQMRHHLFLAVHEALTNILKHSGATRAKVAMTYAGSMLRIAVSDNGRGFDPSLAESRPEHPATGDGLRNMSARLAEIGGHCTVHSRPENGTTIKLDLHLRQFAEKEPQLS